MQKIAVGELNNKALTFVQLENENDIKQANVPQGVCFFWEYEGQRIYAPGEVVNLVLEHSQAGTLNINNFITKQNIESYYQNLYDTQRKNILSQFEKLKNDINGTPNISSETKKAALENLENSIKNYRNNIPFPDRDGIFSPSLDQAIALAGGQEQLDKIFTKEQQNALFRR